MWISSDPKPDLWRLSGARLSPHASRTFDRENWDGNSIAIDSLPWYLQFVGDLGISVLSEILRRLHPCLVPWRFASFSNYVNAWSSLTVCKIVFLIYDITEKQLCWYIVCIVDILGKCGPFDSDIAKYCSMDCIAGISVANQNHFHPFPSTKNVFRCMDSWFPFCMMASTYLRSFCLFPYYGTELCGSERPLRIISFLWGWTLFHEKLHCLFTKNEYLHQSCPTVFLLLNVLIMLASSLNLSFFCLSFLLSFWFSCLSLAGYCIAS